jgi:hypothetical protein
MIYGAKCQECGATTRWVTGEPPARPVYCEMCGGLAKWEPPFCPSTHGAAGPFSGKCGFCGYEAPAGQWYNAGRLVG